VVHHDVGRKNRRFGHVGLCADNQRCPQVLWDHGAAHEQRDQLLWGRRLACLRKGKRDACTTRENRSSYFCAGPVNARRARQDLRKRMERAPDAGHPRIPERGLPVLQSTVDDHQDHSLESSICAVRPAFRERHLRVHLTVASRPSQGSRWRLGRLHTTPGNCLAPVNHAGS